MEPEISIVIPVWNRQNKILTALQSIEKQTFKNIEVIVVDDGSDDNSVNVIKQYKNTSKLNINLIQIEHSGVSIARNYGIDNAKGDYIFFLDSDDYIFKSDLLENLLKIFKEHEFIDVVATNFYYFKISSRPLGNKNTIYDGNQLILNLKIVNCNYNPSLYFVKKEFLTKHNIKFMEHHFAEDRLFVFDLAYNNAKFYITNITSVIRTVSDNSTTNTNGKYDYYHIIIFKYILEKLKLKYHDKNLLNAYYNILIDFLEKTYLSIDEIYKEEFKKYLNELKEWGNESNFTNTSN